LTLIDWMLGVPCATNYIQIPNAPMFIEEWYLYN